MDGSQVARANAAPSEHEPSGSLSARAEVIDILADAIVHLASRRRVAVHGDLRVPAAQGQ
jgi:hypothetical protein